MTQITAQIEFTVEELEAIAAMYDDVERVGSLKLTSADLSARAKIAEMLRWPF